MDLDIYNLDVQGAASTTGTYSTTLMYQTAGNASDGSLSLYLNLATGAAGTTHIFPIGSGGKYTPALVTQSASFADAGKLTISLADSYHPATIDNTKTIPYYWVVSKTGLITISYTDLKYTFTYPGAFPASVNKGSNLYDVDYDWYEFNGVVNGHDIEFPYAAYLTGDFTLGNKSVFNKPTIYYSRGAQGSKNWSDVNTWSLTGHDGVAAGSLPNSYDIVKIGYATGANQYHWVIMDIDNTTVAGVIFTGDATSWNPRLYIKAGHTQNLTKVSGYGDIRLYVTPTAIPVVNGDLGDFLEGTNNYFAYHIQADGEVRIPAGIDQFPNLRIE
jgi:hypothetical protein